MSKPSAAFDFPALLQDFFCQGLIAQRNASAQTVASYRDTFRLLLHYAQTRTNKAPIAITLADLDVPLVTGFLDHLEKHRGNSVRTRNARLAAIRSFLHHASYRDPASLPMIQRVLAIPLKRFDRPLLGFLSRPEIDAIIAAPDRATWSGLRDHVMLATFYNTGARVSEVISLSWPDIRLNRSPSVHIHGKGRKERVVPLWKNTAALLREWAPRAGSHPLGVVFPNRGRKPLTRSGVESRLRDAVELAQRRCPSLKDRSISPHTLRHTTAMHLLQSGVDITVIALWLGHESTETTHLYIEADLAMKERALKRVPSPSKAANRYAPPDQLIAFLEAL